jgi:hypothetical protein
MDVGLATVYRVLTQFEQAGLLNRNHFETGKAIFELNEGSHHDHLVCLDCGRVEEFFDEEIESRQQARSPRNAASRSPSMRWPSTAVAPRPPARTAPDIIDNRPRPPRLAPSARFRPALPALQGSRLWI